MRVWAALSLLLACGAALGHLGSPEGRFPFFSDGVLVGGGSTWGTVLLDDDGCFVRTCEEAISETPRFYHRTSDGRLLVGTLNGLLVSGDRGCSWFPGTPPLGTISVRLLAVPRDVPGRLWMASNIEGGDDALWRSDDEGMIFAASGYTPGGLTLESLMVSDDGTSVWAAGLTEPERLPRVLYSTDSGESFTAKDDWPADVERVNIVGFDSATGGPALSLLGAFSGSRLSTFDADLATETDLGAFEQGIVTDYVRWGADRFVLINRQQLWRQAGSAGDFALDMAGPTRCLRRGPAGDDRLWGCGQTFHLGHFLVTSDGETWERELPYLAVTERLCPAGTYGRTICNEMLELLPPEGDGGVCLFEPGPDGGEPEPAPEPEPEPGSDGGSSDGGEQTPACACDQGSSSPPLSLASFGLAASWLAWRRLSRSRRSAFRP